MEMGFIVVIVVSGLVLFFWHLHGYRDPKCMCIHYSISFLLL